MENSVEKRKSPNSLK